MTTARRSAALLTLLFLVSCDGPTREARRLLRQRFYGRTVDFQDERVSETGQTVCGKIWAEKWQDDTWHRYVADLERDQVYVEPEDRIAEEARSCPPSAEAPAGSDEPAD